MDGRFVTGVLTTGIYCRPVCPASPARLENCRFFPSAAAAQEAGFRPCLRCRPETAPDAGAWRGSESTVSRGLALIAEGELESMDELAERLGVGARQLRRLFKQHLGASPLAVAQTRRVLFAKQLIHDTDLGMTEIALASGNAVLAQLLEVVGDLFAEEQRLILDIFGSRQRDHEEHLGILEALERKDEELCIQRMRTHLEGVEAAIRQWDPEHHPVPEPRSAL
jgi:AraC family transcriptional regulator of adaptative response / DNA-3-methyladenine glycosylase II